jgi:hypothetical protein
MSRKRRHIQASPDEWIVVHRRRESGGGNGDTSGCLGLIIGLVIVSLLLHSC